MSIPVYCVGCMCKSPNATETPEYKLLWQFQVPEPLYEIALSLGVEREQSCVYVMICKMLPHKFSSSE